MEDRERHERGTCTALVGNEGREKRGCGREPAHRLGRAPADLGSPDERVDQKQHPCCDEHRSWEVEAALPAPTGFAVEERERAEAGEDRDRHVEVEDPAPPGPFGEDAAENDAEGPGETRDGRPRPERQVAVAPVGEGCGQDRKRGR